MIGATQISHHGDSYRLKVTGPTRPLCESDAERNLEAQVLDARREAVLAQVRLSLRRTALQKKQCSHHSEQARGRFREVPLSAGGVEHEGHPNVVLCRSTKASCDLTSLPSGGRSIVRKRSATRSDGQIRPAGPAALAL